MTSGVFRQAVTLAKPQGGVGGHLNANALAGGGDASGDMGPLISRVAGL